MICYFLLHLFLLCEYVSAFTSGERRSHCSFDQEPSSSSSDGIGMNDRSFLQICFGTDGYRRCECTPSSTHVDSVLISVQSCRLYLSSRQWLIALLSFWTVMERETLLFCLPFFTRSVASRRKWSCTRSRRTSRCFCFLWGVATAFVSNTPWLLQ